MKDALRQTRSHLMELFEQHGFHPRTDLGQNFLIDLNLVEYIVDQAFIGPEDVVLEIGTGTGGMTTFLAAQSAKVISVEVDTNMYRFATEVVAPLENVTLLHLDALKNKNSFSPELLEIIESQLAEVPNGRLKLVSNLPYSIATPVISNLVATDLNWERMIVTIQLELGRRMIAKPGTGSYGALSVWLQSQCRVKLLKQMPPNVFWPRPKVFSAIVRLLPDLEGRHAIKDRGFFHDFLRRVFHQKRKLLRSVTVGMYRKELQKSGVDSVLASLDLKENARAEELNSRTLVKLSNRLHAAIHQKVESG